MPINILTATIQATIEELPVNTAVQNVTTI
jgi:hypothetical protein